jgi:hypothetical protein
MGLKSKGGKPAVMDDKKQWLPVKKGVRNYWHETHR